MALGREIVLAARKAMGEQRERDRLPGSGVEQSGEFLPAAFGIPKRSDGIASSYCFGGSGGAGVTSAFPASAALRIAGSRPRSHSIIVAPDALARGRLDHDHVGIFAQPAKSLSSRAEMITVEVNRYFASSSSFACCRCRG